jgi:hypothetical protein
MGENRRSLDKMYRRFMKRRDVILEGMSPAPPPVEPHINIAILEAWADGNITEAPVHEKVAEIHGAGVRCPRCTASIEDYRHSLVTK